MELCLRQTAAFSEAGIHDLLCCRSSTPAGWYRWSAQMYAVEILTSEDRIGLCCVL